MQITCFEERHREGAEEEYKNKYGVEVIDSKLESDLVC